MAQISRKFIRNNAVDGTKIQLQNNQTIRGRNAANTADIDILKVNASNQIELASIPKVGSQNLLDASLLSANNGIATLDAGGKIPASQLPTTIMTYEGTWNASTNSPTLADGTGDTGMVYLVSVSGTQNLGSGSISFAAGDWVVYNGSIWQKSVNSNSVASVNGQTGVVTLSTDNISEGITNKYFTDGRAQSAVISQSITNEVTDKAPSENAVFDALALKAPLDSPALTGTPTATTASPNNNSTRIATTAYVDNAVTSSGLVGGDMITISSGTISIDLATSSGLQSTNPGNAAGQLQIKVNSGTIKINASNELEPLKQKQQAITLSEGDITNQYVDLSHAVYGASASDNSVSLTVIGGLTQEKTVDYTVALTGGSGGVTRISFAGDLASGGAAELIAGDKLIVSYSYL